MKLRCAAATLAALLLAARPAGARENDAPLPTLFGPLPIIGEERPKLGLDEFSLRVDSSARAVEVVWAPDSLQWIRRADGLVVPRARLRVRAADRAALDVGADYRGRRYPFAAERDGSASSEFFVDLFDAAPVVLLQDGAEIGRVAVDPRPKAARGARHMIDYSCAPFGASLEGADDLFASVSCQLIRLGGLGAEQPMLEVDVFVVGLKSADGRAGPVTAIFYGDAPVRWRGVDSTGRSRQIVVRAVVPEKLRRLRLAAGVGPYRLLTKDVAVDRLDYAPAVMLYANYYIEGGLSLRAFDGAVSAGPARGPLFNNFGAYFSYELFKALDNRVQTVALIGAQGITFAPQGLEHAPFSQLIYPQGFELTYSNAFGQKGRSLSGGAFLSPETTTPYRNFWLRYGGRAFAELNYITWSYGSSSAAMWGASFGFPLSRPAR
jgi:hypothetical protein